MKLIEAIRHDDDGTYQFLVNGITWFDGVTEDKAMARLVYIVSDINAKAENYEIAVHY